MTEPRAGTAGEAALVRAVANGSEDALATLYDRHTGGVHAVALRLTGDRGIAEEVVQETFLALWNRAELFDPGVASLATWLRAIARNRAVDRLRAAGRRPALVSLTGHPDDDADAGLDRFGTDAAVVGGAAPDVSPEAAAEAADLYRTVAAALATMPEQERAVIVLAYREGLTQQEIAERLAWPLGTVKTRTRRALAHLRGLLEADDEPVGTGPVIRED